MVSHVVKILGCTSDSGIASAALIEKGEDAYIIGSDKSAFNVRNDGGDCETLWWLRCRRVISRGRGVERLLHPRQNR